MRFYWETFCYRNFSDIAQLSVIQLPFPFSHIFLRKTSLSDYAKSEEQMMNGHWVGEQLFMSAEFQTTFRLLELSQAIVRKLESRGVTMTIITIVEADYFSIRCSSWRIYIPRSQDIPVLDRYPSISSIARENLYGKRSLRSSR